MSVVSYWTDKDYFNLHNIMHLTKRDPAPLYALDDETVCSSLRRSPLSALDD